MAKILNNRLIANALSTVFLMQFTYYVRSLLYTYVQYANYGTVVSKLMFRNRFVVVHTITTML